MKKIIDDRGFFVEFEDGQINSCGESGTGGEFVDGYIYPAFNDSHCHILPTGLDLLKLHLGKCNSQKEVLEAVATSLQEMESNDIPEKEWLHAVHYDQNKFEDGKHISQQDLDKISITRPISLRHVNGHASVVNSAALTAAGVDESTQDPEGGTYVRDEIGKLTGVLLEVAHESVTKAAPTPNLEKMVEAILAAAHEMARFGITSAADMMTGRWNLAQELEAYKIAAEKGSPVRFVLYLQWSAVLGPRGLGAKYVYDFMEELDDMSCSIGGLKIFADGAIGSATAAVHEPYVTGGHGSLIYKPERLNEMILLATKKQFSVAVHTIGDACTDMVMDAFEQSSFPASHRLEHIMILSDEQIARIKSLGCMVTMQPEFLHRFGHSYKAQLGPERTSKLKRFRSILDAGIEMSFNSDRPIVLGDPIIGMLTAISRPEGFDSSENITCDEALNAYTWMGAKIGDQGGFLGLLEPGYCADFVILSKTIEEIAADYQSHEVIPGQFVRQVIRGGEVTFTNPDA